MGVGGVPMVGKGGSNAFVPRTKEDEVRGWPQDADGNYEGGRITKPGAFMSYFRLEVEDMTPLMLQECRSFRKLPEAGDWWCMNCGYVCNYKSNRECWSCSASVNSGVRYREFEIEDF